MKQLQKETFVFKVKNEDDAAKLIEEQKESSKGVVSYRADYKTKVSKGEIIDDWYIVTVTHDYTK